MSSTTRVTLIQLLLLAVAITCGLLGVMRLKQEPDEVAVQLLDYALTLTDRAEDAVAEEQRLRAEGLDEEVYHTVDNRLNAELDWQESRQQLKRFLEPAAIERLESFDIVKEPAALGDEIASQRFWLASPVPAWVLLSAAGLFMLGALAARPILASAPAPAPGTAPSANPAPGDDGTDQPPAPPEPPAGA